MAILNETQTYNQLYETYKLKEQTMTIPPTTAEQIITAIKKFDSEIRHESDWQDWINKKSHKFAILWNDQIYPVKEVFRLAL